jgi:hypothetical protein
MLKASHSLYKNRQAGNYAVANSSPVSRTKGTSVDLVHLLDTEVRIRGL